MSHRLSGGWISALALLLGAAGLAGAAPATQPESPVIPGYEQLNDTHKFEPAVLGEVLIGELNCLACHAPAGETRVMLRGAPDLSAVGQRITPQYLEKFLANPHQMKPGTSMPDLLHAMPAEERGAAVESLTHFLVAQGGPIGPDKLGGNGALVERGRTLYHTVGCVACHAPEKQELERILKAAGAKGKPGTTGAPAPATPKGAPAAAAPKPAAPGPAPAVATPATQPLKVRSVPLGHLAAKTTVSELAAFLMDPLKVRPSSRMPSLELTASDAQAIAVYLLYEQLEAELLAEAATRPATNPAIPANATNQPAGVKLHSPGVHFSYFERDAKAKDCKPEGLEKLTPKKQGIVHQITLDIPDRAKNDFAVRFDSLLTVPRDGKYTFFSKSDDGSRLYLDGKIILEHDGIHADKEKAAAELDLKSGSHAFTVAYFQHDRGSALAVSWQGPGIAKQEIPASVLYDPTVRPMSPIGASPFAVDANKAKEGSRLFASLGCASCHTLQSVPTQLSAKALASLDAANAQGCLSDTPETIGKNVPRFDLSPEQRAAIRASLGNVAGFSTPLPPAERVVHMLAALNCFACHVRDEIGGPGPGRAEFFSSVVPQDLGEEGRLPPKLTGVGAKLTPAAIVQIVFENKLHVRPYVATHMPRFSRDRLPGLPEMLEKADTPAAAAPVPPVDDGATKDGRQLVGTRGMGCVNCHGVAGVKPLGAPSVDLATVHDRLRPEWFARLLHDPGSVNPGTRMPAFWADGDIAFKDIAGGTFEGQAHAIWSYLAAGSKMSLPFGLAETSDELSPTEEPIVLRAFITGVGPRAIAVGFPESVHVAFDADVVRLSIAWRGRFFDAKSIWEKRGGTFAAPLGSDLLPMPPGPAFAFLASPSGAWPVPKEGERNIGGHFKGYVLDKQQRPTFRYELEGVEIREQPLPLPGKIAGLSRQFHLSAPAAAEGKELYFLAASGRSIKAGSLGVWIVDEHLTVRIPANPASPQPIVRDSAGTSQLLVPVTFINGQASFGVEISW